MDRCLCYAAPSGVCHLVVESTTKSCSINCPTSIDAIDSTRHHTCSSDIPGRRAQRDPASELGPSVALISSQLRPGRRIVDGLPTITASPAAAVLIRSTTMLTAH